MEKHSVMIENRETITITEVKGVDTLDEEEVCVQLTEGGMIIHGKGLHIQKLDLEEGVAVVSGAITSLAYTKKKVEKCRFKKLIK